MKKTPLFLLGCALLPLAACITTPAHENLASGGPLFDPITFFAGRTVGEAVLQVVLSGSTPVHVLGTGEVEPDGTLVLAQRVQRGNDAPQERTWRIRPAGGGRYSGTLTSAEGPVAVEVSGNRLHLRFVSEGGLDTEQWLYLQPGGRVALNRMVVRKFGLPVAALEETIRKID